MSSPRSTDHQRAGVAFLLAQVGAHAALKFRERLEPLHLAPAHAGILRAIDESAGISQRKLAALLGMFPSRLVLVLDEMERAGLIQRQASAGDRRTYALHLTAKGGGKLNAIWRAGRGHQDKLCAALSAGERETLAGLLARIAGEQGLTPGVHPGYRQIGRGGRENC